MKISTLLILILVSLPVLADEAPAKIQGHDDKQLEAMLDELEAFAANQDHASSSANSGSNASTSSTEGMSSSASSSPALN